MKKILIIISGIFGLSILVITIFLYYMGMFISIDIKEKEMGPYTFAYIEHIGPYMEVGKPMMELDTQLREAGFNSVNGIGIYFDDPSKTPEDKLRSHIGSIITAKDMDKIEQYKDKFQFKTLAKTKYLVAEFPIKNQFSYILGPIRIYPAFSKYLNKKGIPIPNTGIEIYNMENNTIYFMMEYTK